MKKNAEMEPTFKFQIYYNTYLQVSPTIKHNTSIAGIIKVHVGCTPTTIDNNKVFQIPNALLLVTSAHYFIILIEFVI